MRQTSFQLLILMTLFWLFPLWPVQSETISNELDKGYDLAIKNHKVYLHAQDSPLEPILKELSHKLQIRIRTIGTVDAKISGKIGSASLEVFIKRISLSYAVVTREGDPQAKTYYVLPKSNITLQPNLQDDSDSSQVPIETFIEVAPGAAVEAARQGLPRYISAAIGDNPALYGFSSDTELKETTLDDPFQVYTLDPGKLLATDVSSSFDSLVVPTNQWFFPVMAADGTYRSILSVDLIQGQWEAVSFGSAGLANQLHTFVDRWGALQNRQIKFVRVYQAFSDLIIRRQGNEVSIYPLASAVQSLKLDNINKTAGFYSPEEILNALRIALKKKKESFVSN